MQLLINIVLIHVEIFTENKTLITKTNKLDKRVLSIIVSVLLILLDITYIPGLMQQHGISTATMQQHGISTATMQQHGISTATILIKKQQC